jgi:hypothetical protein
VFKVIHVVLLSLEVHVTRSILGDFRAPSLISEQEAGGGEDFVIGNDIRVTERGKSS